MLWELRNKPNHIQNEAKMNEISMLKIGVSKLNMEDTKYGRVSHIGDGKGIGVAYILEPPSLIVSHDSTPLDSRRVRSTLTRSRSRSRTRTRGVGYGRNVAFWWRTWHFAHSRRREPLESRLSIFDHAWSGPGVIATTSSLSQQMWTPAAKVCICSLYAAVNSSKSAD
jgi:hypothetical protein